LKKIILFASGSGTNVEAIVKYFAKEIQVSIELLVCNNLKAKVVQKAKAFKINTLIVNRKPSTIHMKP
jgi:phosphoribosylglycinamide formyltransferase-1